MDRFAFYLPAVLGLSLAAVCLWHLIAEPSGRSPQIAIIAVLCGALGLLAAWWQRRSLRYRCAETPAAASELYPCVLAVMEEAGWEIVEWEPGRLVRARVSGWDGSFWSWSFGESVEVLIEDHRVCVNSINDPRHPATLYLPWKNRRHEDRVLDVVKDLDRAPG